MHFAPKFDFLFNLEYVYVMYIYKYVCMNFIVRTWLQNYYELNTYEKPLQIVDLTMLQEQY